MGIEGNLLPRPRPGHLVGACILVGLLAGISLPAQEVVAEEQLPPGVLARVGGDVLTVEEFSARLDRLSAVDPSSFDSLDDRRAELERWLRERALVAAAKQAGYDRDPEVMAALERIISSRYSEDHLQPRLSSLRVSEEEIRAHYDQNRGLYSTPERVRVALIKMEIPAGASPQEVERFERRAEAILEEAKAMPADTPGFGNLARQYSDDAGSKYVGGVVGWLHPGRPYVWGDEVAAAAFAIPDPGGFSGVVRGADGLYLVRLVARDDRRVLPYERYEAGIRHQLLEQRQREERESFYRGLLEQTEVQVDDAALAAIVPEPVPRQPPPVPTESQP